MPKGTDKDKVDNTDDAVDMQNETESDKDKPLGDKLKDLLFPDNGK
jgi:hypothetical protein